MKRIEEMKTLDRVRERYVPEKVKRLSEEEMQLLFGQSGFLYQPSP